MTSILFISSLLLLSSVTVTNHAGRVAKGGVKSASVKTGAKSTQLSRYEQLAMTMLPQEKINRATGFFGPVVKKHLPTFERFQSEFQVSKNKREVIQKYLPDADAALSDAKAMKVPAKYENEKAEYIQMAETFLSVLRVSVAIGK